jgi:hypothetical protein
MADITYTIILQDRDIKAFTMPDGFWPDVEIHCWGAGGGTGWGGALGGGGGYAKATVNLVTGDEVSLQIGKPGLSATSATVAGAGGLDTTYRRYRGGNGGGRGYWCGNVNGPYPSGGGGGASWVAVNNYPVCVAAGGGGGGGYGHKGVKYSGNPGGVYSGLTTIPQGGDAIYGGGGGAGYLGGISGSRRGHEVTGGNGGLNYGDITLAGSGASPGGTNTDYYPGDKKGTAGYPGYIAIVLRKKLNVSIKDADGSGNWANIASAYVKMPAQTVSTLGGSVTTSAAGWKQIQAAWTKINGSWKQILTNKSIDLYNYPVKRVSANIIISSDTNDYNLYNNLPAEYFEGLMDISVWVLPGVVITGNTSSTAFTINGFNPGDTVQLNNYGTIEGVGGRGGNGGYTYSVGKNSYTALPTAGQAGGTGLLLQFPTVVINNGNIAGGGGGGGSGGTTSTTSGKTTTTYLGGGGGGGAGYGQAGIGSPAGNGGTLTSGGAGGDSTGGDGGSGGARGTRGSDGASGGMAGGAAGYAISGIFYLKPGSNTGAYFGPLA